MFKIAGKPSQRNALGPGFKSIVSLPWAPLRGPSAVEEPILYDVTQIPLAVVVVK
jgi:hypothetical protein